MLYRRIKKRFNKLIVLLYVLTVSGLLGSIAFSVHQNWKLRLETTQTNLARNAGIGNFMVESALVSASKSLDATRKSLIRHLHDDSMNRQQVHQSLLASLKEFNTYNKSEIFGLLFFVDRNGMLFARSDQYPTQPIDFSDRYYFRGLRDHPEKERVISPLVQARTTQRWVFHLAVPVRNDRGELQGVLVQQILATDIASDLDKYVDTAGFTSMMTHASDNEVAFVYPSPIGSTQSHENLLHELSSRLELNEALQGTFTWRSPETNGRDELLVGFARSHLFGLVTCVTLPMHDVVTSFWKDSIPLLYLAVAGVVLLSVVFYYLYVLSDHLTQARRESLHDPLTRIPNRRALDDMLPRLLRESMRSGAPLSVLFIDIDHFGAFNNSHGHERGDDALRAVAQSLTTCASRPLDFICRWGGEEFVVLLPHTSLSAAEEIALKMLLTVRGMQLQGQDGSTLHITISIGVSSSTVTRENYRNNLIDAADRAMQQAKQAGRDRYVVFNDHYSEVTGYAQMAA